MNSLLTIIVVLIVILVIFMCIRPRRRERQRHEDFVHFPFRAIYKEMPREVITTMQHPEQIKLPSPPPPPQPQNQYYEQTPKPQQPVVNEIYPVGYTAGETMDRLYNVRPSLYGALTLRDTERPYQDINTEFVRVGNVLSESKSDDTIMTLYRRDIAPERDLYEYKVVDKTGGNNTEVFLSTNTTLLRNGDKITIPGYESKGLFDVMLDTRYRYSRLKPYY